MKNLAVIIPFYNEKDFLEISVNKQNAEEIINNQLLSMGLDYNKVKNLIKENEERRIT